MKDTILNGIDAIAEEAIAAKATPGCVVTVLRKGKLVFQKGYGRLSYTSPISVTPSTIYDLASVTKTSATNVSVMKLVEDGKLDVKAPIGNYLPWLKGSDKENLLVENLLMHQAGLNAFIPFYKEVTDKNGNPLPAFFSNYKHQPFTTDVTDAVYLRSDWPDSMYQRIKTSKLTTGEVKYVYSDNDFILLGKIVEAVSGLPLDEYARLNFYDPLEMGTTRFKAYNHFPNSLIAPTENEKILRQGLIWGYVHDPGAAMFGNVAGHAGLFSNSTDLAKLYQMLLNGGFYDGKTYLKKETIDWFTSYQTPISRRGLGFDKPEKDNDVRPIDKAYPNKYASPLTYGHTGFTGICVWVDPQYDLIYIFMSNRVNPDGGDNGKLSQLNIRSRIQDVIYQSIFLH
jgi:beta-N-acetylhexosaminidase